MIDIGTDTPKYLNDVSIVVSAVGFSMFNVDVEYVSAAYFCSRQLGPRGAAAAAAKCAFLAATGLGRGGWETGKAPTEAQGLEDFLYNTDINRVVIDVTSDEDRATLLAQAMCDWFTF